MGWRHEAILVSLLVKLLVGLPDHKTLIIKSQTTGQRQVYILISGKGDLLGIKGLMSGQGTAIAQPLGLSTMASLRQNAGSVQNILYNKWIFK